MYVIKNEIEVSFQIFTFFFIDVFIIKNHILKKKRKDIHVQYQQFVSKWN